MRVLSIETEYDEYFTWEEDNPSKRLSNVRYIVDVEHVMGGHFVKSEVEVPASKFDEDYLTADSMKDYLLKLFNGGDKVMGEEVRKKQLYKVEVPDPESHQTQTRKALYRRHADKAIVMINAGKETWESSGCKLTEEEIKRNHSYLWEFAEPVEEPKYIVPIEGLFRNGNQAYLFKVPNVRNSNLDWPEEVMVRMYMGNYSFTEAEIKAINSDFWEYAIPVDVWLEGEKD